MRTGGNEAEDGDNCQEPHKRTHPLDRGNADEKTRAEVLHSYDRRVRNAILLASGRTTTYEELIERG